MIGRADGAFSIVAVLHVRTKSLHNPSVTAAPAPSPSTGGAIASPPKVNVAAGSADGSATILLATVATLLLAFYYL